MIKFSEIPYSRPDMGEVKDEMIRLTKEFEEADTYEKARLIVKEMTELLVLDLVSKKKMSIY